MASKTKKENLVIGRVTDNLNRALADLLVKVYDRDMRSEEPGRVHSMHHK